MNPRIAIVTGASRLKGIGRAICMELARNGIDIFFTYWTPYDHQMPWKVEPEEPRQIKEEVHALGRRCVSMELNLTAPAAIDQLMDQVQQELGAPHIIINNATYSTETTLENMTGAELDRHYQLNIKATTMLIQAFIRQFAHTEGGRIINMTSGQSLGEMPNEIAYAMTKGAIETLTKTISQKIATKGITINAVNPGPTDTGWMDAELQAELLKQFPMKRIGQPEDAARLVAFLCSEAAGWITGQIIHSEGGFMR